MNKARREILETLFLAGIIAFLLNSFIVQLYWIPSPSMEPTLLVGDRVVVSRMSYWNNEPERGDIVVFKFPQDEKLNLTKRIIGLPGETLTIKDNQVYINNEALKEAYVPPQKKVPDFGPVLIPTGQYFMMGDNRDNSADSRVWGFVTKKQIKGKAKFRYWPFARAGKIEAM